MSARRSRAYVTRTGFHTSAAVAARTAAVQGRAVDLSEPARRRQRQTVTAKARPVRDGLRRAAWRLRAWLFR